MRHRWVVVVASLASIGSCVPLTMKARKGFLPIDDRAQFEVVVRLPEGSSVPATELTGERVARRIREFPEVSATLVTVGDDGARSPNVARIFVDDGLLREEPAPSRRTCSRTSSEARWCPPCRRTCASTSPT